MRLKYTCIFDSRNEDLYIHVNGKEEAIIIGESVDICLGNNNVTIFTKAHKNITFFNTFILFFQRLILNLFNIIIMNPPEKWYKKAEPFSVRPFELTVLTDTEIKYVPTRIDLLNRKITQRQFLINGDIIDCKNKVELTEISLSFITYVFDLISLFIYACVPISLFFICSDAIVKPIMLFSWIAIVLIVLIPIICKISKTNKERIVVMSILKSAM